MVDSDVVHVLNQHGLRRYLLQLALNTLFIQATGLLSLDWRVKLIHTLQLKSARLQLLVRADSGGLIQALRELRCVKKLALIW
mgnify:CR=1 FL=1